jgi:hypothetical protein
MKNTVEIKREEIKRLYQRIHDLTKENEQLQEKLNERYKAFMVIDTQSRPYILDDFSKACHLAQQITLNNPIAVFGIEKLVKTVINKAVTLEKI